MARRGNTIVIYTQGEIVDSSGLVGLFYLYQNQINNNPPLEEGLHEDVFVGTQNCKFNVEVVPDGTARIHIIPRSEGIDALFASADGKTLRSKDGLTIALDQPWSMCPCCDVLPGGKFEVWGFVLFKSSPPLVA